MHCLVRAQLCRSSITSAVTNSTIRWKHHKTPAERLPAFVRYEHPEIPAVNEDSKYSEEDKLRLWSEVRPSELRPPFFQFTKEERARLGLEDIENVAYVPGLKRQKTVEVIAGEKPYSEIYSGSEDQGNFTASRNLLHEQPDRWYWVQRLMPSSLHPRQTRPDAENAQRTAAGYVAPAAQPPSLPYFVPRTRNNLLPVYKIVEYKDQKAKTVIRNVAGDLWLLERELRSLLEPIHRQQCNGQERLLSSVNESNGEIRFMGSFERVVADRLIKLGF